MILVGGDSKVDKLLSGRYVRKMDFIGRNNLRAGLLDIASLFEAVYRPHDLPRWTEHLYNCLERLNKFEDGGRCVMQMLQELIESSVKWTDAPAKRVVLPLSLR